MDSMGEVVSAISGVMGMGQAQLIHREGLEVTHSLHREAIAQAERFHQQSMDFDLLSAMRENSRDIWAQKNNTYVLPLPGRFVVLPAQRLPRVRWSGVSWARVRLTGAGSVCAWCAAHRR